MLGLVKPTRAFHRFQALCVILEAALGRIVVYLINLPSGERQGEIVRITTLNNRNQVSQYKGWSHDDTDISSHIVQSHMLPVVRHLCFQMP